MASTLRALCFDSADPARLARFWADLLDREPAGEPGGGVTLPRPAGEPGFDLRFLPGQRPKTGQNQMHVDLTSTSLADQRHTVARALSLGARHLDIGQGPDAEHVVLADPEGNEFCVIEPGNQFLAGCGFIGALACDGSQQTGYFWSEALRWPLVWDQDQETAIQSPQGGTKITWGGPPLAPKAGKYRLHLDLAPAAGTSQQTEADRLLALGAARADIGQGAVSWMVLTDPDGHEFCLLPG